MAVLSAALFRRLVLALLFAIAPGLVAPTLADARPGATRTCETEKTKRKKQTKKSKKKRRARRTKRKKTKKRSRKRSRRRVAKRRTANRSKAKRKKVRRGKRRRKTKAVTAKRIRYWQRKGLSDNEIVAQVSKRGGYALTKKKWRRLKKYRIRKSLRRRLAQLHRAKKRGEPAPINLAASMDPNDIDFDSVAPPPGMDMEFADLHRKEAAVARRSPKRRARRARASRKRRTRRRVIVAPSGE